MRATRLIVCLAIGLFGLASVSCTHTTPLTLRCDVDRKRAVPLDALRDSVARPAAEFGYEVRYANHQSHLVGFARERAMSPRVADLPGASARVDLGIVANSVSIQDFQHSYETPFVIALKQSIERQLQDDFGVSDMCFERKWSPLGP